MVGTLLFFVSAVLIIFIIFYKRGMLVKMFSMQASAPAVELQQQLEKTADVILKRLENQIVHLEFLLDEADNKMAELDDKLKAVTKAAGEYFEAASSRPGSGFDVSLPAEKPISEESLEAVSFPQDNHNKEAKDGISGDKRRIIATMAEQGYSITEIAKATSLGKGEIMLFMQLHRK